MEDIEFLNSLQKLELKSNDIVVLNMEGSITQSKYDMIQEMGRHKSICWY